MTAPTTVVGLALITAFSASASVLQDVEVKKTSSNSLLVLWRKPENVSLETWQNFTYYLRISPKKVTSPVIEYILDTEDNLTSKEFCLQEADATLQITYCPGRWCEDTSVLQNISFTEASNWFSELEIILSQKQPYIAIGTGITLVISLFLAVIFICCRYKQTSGLPNKCDSTQDSETNVQAVQFTDRRPSRDPAAPPLESISSAAPPDAPDALEGSQEVNYGGERTQQPSGPRSLSAHTLLPLPSPLSDVRISSELMHPSNDTSGVTLFLNKAPPLLPSESPENIFFATLPSVSDSTSTWQPTSTGSPATLDRFATRPPADLPRLPSATLPRPAGTKHSPDPFDRMARRPPAPLPPEAAAPPPLPPWSSGVVVSRLNKHGLPPAMTPPPATAGARIFFDTARCERDAAPALPPAVISTATLPRRRDPAPLRQKTPLPPLTGTLPRMAQKMLNRPLPPIPSE